MQIHVGVKSPVYWDRVDASERALRGRGVSFEEGKRPVLVDVDWAAAQFEPRWLGEETTDCLVAMNPVVGQELDRFLDGCRRREEVAMLMHSTDEEDLETHNIFGSQSTYDILPWTSRIVATLLPAGGAVHVATGATGEDRDLANRLAQRTHAWSRQELVGMDVSPPRVTPKTVKPPQGELIPLVQNGAGETVVAVWVSPDGMERHYILPPDVDWGVVASWLAGHALYEFNITAMRRHQRPGSSHPDLRTAREATAIAALEDFDARVAADRKLLADEARAAVTEGDEMRDRLFFGRSAALVAAVTDLFTWAGIVVTDLDALYVKTKSADLYCSWNGRSRLVEVKSAGSAAASDTTYLAMKKHLDVWRAAKDRDPVEGGALVINHDFKTDPLERSRAPFPNKEFTDAMTESVITVRELFDAWRCDDRAAVRELLFPGGATAEPDGAAEPPTVETRRSLRAERRKR